jgi:hypothetical protein
MAAGAWGLANLCGWDVHTGMENITDEVQHLDSHAVDVASV